MTISELVFEGQRFRVARGRLARTCEIFLENPDLLKKPYAVRARVSETNFRLFVDAINGAPTEIGMKNAFDLELLSTEFQFTGLVRRVAEFVAQHPSVEVVGLKSAIANLQRQLTEHDLRRERDLCLMDIASERARDDHDSLVHGLIGQVENEVMQEAEKVSSLQKTVAAMGQQLEGVTMRLARSEEELLRRVAQLEWVTRALAEANEALKDWLSRVESGRQNDVDNLLEAIAEGIPKVKEDIANVQRELAALKGESTAIKTNRQVFALPAPRLPVATRNPGKQFPPSVKKKMVRIQRNEVEIDVPDGIIAHLTRQCGGNVHDRGVIEVTSSKSVYPDDAAKNIADLEDASYFYSVNRRMTSDMPHTRNNWVCYDFKRQTIVPTHYTVRTSSGFAHLKSWLVETSTDGQNWREVDHHENNKQLNGHNLTATFAVADGRECRFIRLVNVGGNHKNNDALMISAWEIFGTLIE
jgi:hypothetical protein